MDARGLKPKPWAISAGLSDGVVRNFLAGRAESLSGSTLEKLARAADATVAEIIGEKTREPRSSRDVAAVQGLAVQAGMGGGVEISEEPAGEPFYFRRSWLESVLGTNQAMLRVISLRGDSMEPTLHDGDVALVRIGEAGEDGYGGVNGIFALWDGTGLLVKRVQTIPGSPPRLRILSDNQLYTPYDVATDEVHIIGEVIWRGGRLI